MDTIDSTMNDMAEAMTSVNASPVQVRGIAGWRGQVDAAVAAGSAAGGSWPGLMRADAVGSQRHVLWLATAGAVIQTMAMQAAEAQGMAADARERAAGAEEADEAERAEDQADACDAWAAAAADAAAAGRRLIAREDAVHRPVMSAYTSAGGRAWIANDKQFIRGM